MDENVRAQVQAQLIIDEYRRASDELAMLKQQYEREAKAYRGMKIAGIIFGIFMVQVMLSMYIGNDDLMGTPLRMLGTALIVAFAGILYFAMPAGCYAVWRKFSETGFSFVGSLMIMICACFILLFVVFFIGWPVIFHQRAKVRRLDMEVEEADVRYQTAAQRAHM